MFRELPNISTAFLTNDHDLPISALRTEEFFRERVPEQTSANLANFSNE